MKLLWGVVSLLALSTGTLAADGEGCKDICSSSFDGFFGELSSTRSYLEVTLNATFDYAEDSLNDLIASSSADLTAAAESRLEALAMQQSRIARLHEMLENVVNGQKKPSFDRRLQEEETEELSAIPSIKKVYQGQSWVVLSLQTLFALALGVGFEHFRVSPKPRATARSKPVTSYQSSDN